MNHEPDSVQLAELDCEMPSEMIAAIRAVRAQQPSAARVNKAKQRFASEVAASGAANARGRMSALSAKCLAAIAIAITSLEVRVVQQHPVPPPFADSSPAHASLPSPAPAQALAQPAAAPAAPPVISVPVPERAPAPVHARRAHHARNPALALDGVGESANAPPAPPLDSRSEMDLLWPARKALELNPGAALELAEQHAGAYPDGVFAQEREVLAIEALLKLRRVPDALDRAEQFLQRYPDSAHAGRWRALFDASDPRDR